MKTFREYMKKRGVITAHNPMGNKLPDEDNDEANKDLLKHLTSMGHKPLSVTGTYNGHEEEAFEITNITLDELRCLGRKYKQKAVIWGNDEIAC